MDEVFDFVVVGSGAGSMCAALFMRSVGKSVLIVEKTELLGGTTATSGGVMWIPNNRFMQAAGVEDSYEQAVAYLDALADDSGDAPGATRERRLAFINEAPKMVEFLLAQGIGLRRLPSWPDYYDVPGASVPGRTVVAELFDLNRLGEWKKKMRPGFLPLAANLDEAMELALFKRSGAARKVMARVVLRTLTSKMRGKNLATAGAALQGVMLDAALKAGVEIRLNAPVKELLVENGRVTGILTEKNGQDYRVGARSGVLLSAGGFSRNQAMRDKYAPGTSVEWTNTAAGDTGEMIEEAIRIGAAVAQMDERVGGQVALPPGNPAMKPMMQGDVSKPHTIVVDQGGERYMREAASYVDFCRTMLERDKQTPAVPSWMILDSQYMRKFMLAGTMPGSKKPKAWYDEGFLRTGETIEALAAACQIDPATLRATVDRFNGFARQGRDEDFQRGDWVYDRWLGDPLAEGPAMTLGTIEQGPFYAIQVYPGDVSTFGGVVTDANARVLRADGSVIEGLYATGTSTASVMGSKAAGAGASIGPGFTFAYIAAKHAANADNLADASA